MPHRDPVFNDRQMLELRKQIEAEQDKEMTRIRKNVNMANLVDIQTSKKYWGINTMRLNDGQDYLASGIVYVFFTKPNLNLIYNNDIKDPFLAAISSPKANSVARKIVTELDGRSAEHTTAKIIKLLTNSVESFETKDTVLKTREVGDTFLGDKLAWGESTVDSTGPDTFTVEYTEYSDMSITLLHKVWVDYINAVKINRISPSRGTSSDSTDYILEKKVDYASSVYYFLLDADGCTIKYYAKYTGVFPTNVPYSAMSFKLGESNVKKLSIQYQYSFKEDLNPEILDEFIKLTYSNDMPKRDNDFRADKTWFNYVRITRDRKKMFFIM